MTSPLIAMYAFAFGTCFGVLVTLAMSIGRSAAAIKREWEHLNDIYPGRGDSQ